MNFMVTVFYLDNRPTRTFNTDSATRAVVLASVKAKERFVRKVEVSVLLEVFNGQS